MLSILLTPEYSKCNHPNCLFTITIVFLQIFNSYCKRKAWVKNSFFILLRRHKRIDASNDAEEGNFVHEVVSPRDSISRGQNARTSVAVPWHELRRTIHHGRRSRFIWGRIDLRAAIETRESRERFLVSPYGERQMCTRVPVPISSLFCPSQLLSDPSSAAPSPVRHTLSLYFMDSSPPRPRVSYIYHKAISNGEYLSDI